MWLLTRWLVSALSLLLADRLIEGIHIDGLYTALILALFLGFLNAVVRPILIILTLPITVLTLGLFILFINGALFAFLATFIKGFEVDSFGAAVLGALTVSVFSWIGNRLMYSSAWSGDGTYRTVGRYDR